MVRCSLILILVSALTAHSTAQDKLAPPIDGPPVIMVAQASTKDEAIVVRVSNPQPTFKTKAVEVDRDGEKVTVNVTVCEYVWSEVDVKVDGMEIAAFGVDGKAIEPKDLLKRLAKPTQVAVVQNPPGLDRKLDPYYLGALKDDIVVFKGPEEKFRPAPPKK